MNHTLRSKNKISYCIRNHSSIKETLGIILALRFAIYHKNIIATKQLLAIIANHNDDDSKIKTWLHKTVNLLSVTDKNWLRDLY